LLYALIVTVRVSLQGPFSPWPLTQRAMEWAGLPPLVPGYSAGCGTGVSPVDRQTRWCRGRGSGGRCWGFDQSRDREGAVGSGI